MARNTGIGLLAPEEEDAYAELRKLLQDQFEAQAVTKLAGDPSAGLMVPESAPAPMPEPIPVPPSYPGFIPKGDPANPYYVPDPTFRAPLSPGQIEPSPAPEEAPEPPKPETTQPAPMTTLQPEEIPIPSPPQLDSELVVPRRQQQLENLQEPDPPTPQTETQDEGTRQKNWLADNIAESVMAGPAAAIQFTQPYRQAVGEAFGTMAQLPWAVPAGIEALRALTLKGTPEGKQAEQYATNLQRQGEGASSVIHTAVGAKAVPDTMAEYAGGVLGGSLAPAGKMTAPLTGAIAGVRAALDYLHGKPVTSAGQPRAEMPKVLAELLLANPAQAGGFDTIAQERGVAPAAQGEVSKGKGKKPPKSPYIEVPTERPLSPTGVPQPLDKEFAVPGERGRRPFSFTEQPKGPVLKRPSPPKIRAKETPEKFAERVREFERLNNEWLQQFNPTAVKAIQAVGGMRELKESDLTGMGILGAITMGSIALPPIYQLFKRALVPNPMSAAEVRVKAVSNALPGTVTNERLSDVFRMINSDINTATVVWAKRAMMPMDAVEKMDNIIRSTGWSQKQALVDAAINRGYFRANTLEFKSPVSLADIGNAVASDPTGNTKRYLIAKDIFERLNKAEQSRRYRAGQTVREVSVEIENTFAREGVPKAPKVAEGMTRLYYEGDYPATQKFVLSTDTPVGQGRSYYVDVPNKSRSLTRIGPDGTLTVPLKSAENLKPWAEKTIRSKGVPDAVEVTRYNAMGEPIINGLTKEDALNYMDSYRQMNPNVEKVGKMWEAWNTAVRRFESEGEAATLRKKSEKPPGIEDKSFEYLQDQRRGMVPMHDGTDIDMPFDQRVTHTDIINDQNHRSRFRIGERIKNENKLFVIDNFGKLELSDPTQAYFKPFVGKRLPDGSVQTPAQRLQEAPRYKPYIVKVQRRGETEYYTTSPTMRDALTFDPYVITQGVPQALNSVKRALEFNYTGMGNPAFAFTNALRVWHGAKQNNQATRGFGFAGERNPSLYGLAASVPKQLYPQIAKYFADSIQAGTGQRAAQFFGPNGPELLLGIGRRLAPIYDKSTYALIQRHGGMEGNPVSSQIRQQREMELREKGLAQADGKMAAAGRGVEQAWKGTSAFFRAIHESPAFDYVSKNLGKAPTEDLISRARNLGGDPKVSGQYMITDPDTRMVRPIRFESDSKTMQMMGDAMRHYYGPLADLNRYAVPYGNAVVQSVKRVGTAYLNNPLEFTAKVWTTTMMPAMVQYLWNYNAGVDPSTGNPYVRHMMDGRPLQDQLTKWYFAIPGRPASEGVQIPAVTLEMAFPKMAMEIAADGMFGTNRVPIKDDMLRTLYGAADISLGIPMFPPIAIYEASQGRYPAMNLLGESKEGKRYDPYDQYIGMPQSIEHYMRTLGGGIGNAWAAAIAAYSHSDQGFANALKNAASEAAQTQLRRVPIVANVLDITPKLSGSNKITEEVFANFKHMDDLVKAYKSVDLSGDKINVKPRSILGGEIATMQEGPAISEQAPGVAQPPPNNPLYLEFMEDLYGFFKRDNPGFDKNGNSLGGVGFLSLVGRYGQASRALKSLGHIDAGMDNKWQNTLNSADKAEVKAELEANKIDTKDVRAVRNYYEEKRQEAALTLYYYQKAAEKMMSEKYGKPITLKDIKPYTTMFSFSPDTGSTGEAMRGSVAP